MRNLFSSYLRMVAVGLAATFAGALCTSAANTSFKTLSGHVPPVTSHLKSFGDLADTNVLTLTLGLPLRDTNTLEILLQRIYDPSSPDYHQYFTPQQFTARFGPTTNDYQAVIDFARASGFEIVSTQPNRMLLNVRGHAADVARAFHVKLKKFHHPTEPRDFFAPDSDPSVDSTLPIMHVAGLENYYKAKSLLHPAATNSLGKLVGSAPFGSYAGNDFRNAYVPGTSLTGTGQNVALFQEDGFFASDITNYASQFGISNIPNLVTIPIDGGQPVPTTSGSGEVSLDIEMVLSMASGVSNIFLYEGPEPGSTTISYAQEYEDILNKIANDNLARQVSSSWFIPGGLPDAVSEQIYEQMALQGMSVFQASGDFDAWPGFISFPLDSPHITLVGGTTLSTRNNQTYASETVWNYTSLGDDGVGSGGGISTTYSIPSWQTNINMTINQGSSILRNTPDVALTGDNVFVDYGGGFSGVFAGTSCASPLWAGYMALVNEQAQNNNVPPIGFLNPSLYSLLGTTSYTNCFHDIVTGNNEWSQSPSLFSAVPGYDLCDGLGTPNGTNLINVLASGTFTNVVTHISAPPKPYGNLLADLLGGNPNGTWNLFTMDDQALSSGIVSNGWTLILVSGTPVGYSGDNGVTVTASSTNVSLATAVFSYFITATNYGPSTSTNVIVSVTLPAGATVLSSNLTAGSLSLNGPNATWNLGTLTNGAGGALTFSMQATSVGTYTASASASAITPDDNPADDIASVGVVVGTTTPPALSGISIGTGHKFQMNITSLANQTNVVQASTNLANPNGWVPVITNVGPFVFQDLQSTNYRTRFYRDVITGP